ncbi:hypothetical protein D3C78_1191240 [compost metagenome]
MIAGEEGHTAEVNADVAFANALTGGADRNGRHCLNTDVHLFQIVYLANRAVHHDAFPLVLGGQTCQFCVDQGTTYRAATVNHQDATTAVFFKQLE